MSKEFENIQQAVVSKRIEIDTITRANQQNEDNKKREDEKIKEQQRIESERRSIENRKILEDAGVVKLFEEIRDKGLVKYSHHPILKGVALWEQLKNDREGQDQYYSINYNVKTADEFLENRLKHKRIADYYPAKIVWGHECESIRLAFDAFHELEDERYCGDNYPDYVESYHSCQIDVLSNKKIGVKQNIKDPKDSEIEASSCGRSDFKHLENRIIETETEITNLQSYIVDKIVNAK